MNQEPDLFAYPPSGTAAGKTDTSQAAGQRIHPKTQTMRSRIMEIMATGVKLTADEIAAKLAAPPGSVRPRITELFNNGDLVETRGRRKNKAGNRQIVWRSK